MNILPKKRWHVRTKDNVARVRRDQAAAREEEERRVERMATAEREYRTNFLRQRAATHRAEEGQVAVVEEQEQGHVNFFADLEEQERTFGVNKEHEKEKRLEKEAEERKIGLLKYLGEGSSEYMKETPWYLKSRQPVTKEETTKSALISALIKSQSSNDAINKPVLLINRKSSNETVANTSSHSAKKADELKQKKRHRKRSCSSTSSSNEESGGKKQIIDERSISGSTDIAKLRAERLRREREERLKAEAAIRKAKGEKEETIKASGRNGEYEQRYSSQFNPDLARQNRMK